MITAILTIAACIGGLMMLWLIAYAVLLLIVVTKAKRFARNL